MIKDNLTKAELSDLWDKADWNGMKAELFEMQCKLATYAQCKQKNLVKKTQKEIVSSLSAKMLAIAKVASSSSKAGVDGVRWRHSWQKMRAAFKLGEGEYLALPTHLFIIYCKKGKDRNIKLSCMSDRAMQVLHSFALDPICEVFCDKKSFAFRKCRSTHDAHYHIMQMFNVENPPSYAVKADIEKHYETISHDWLIKNIPMDKHVLKEFLKAGYVSDGELFPVTDIGIDLGTSISPILGNSTLDGLQDAIFIGLYKKGAIDYTYGNMVRFADDVVVTAKDKEQAQEILKIMSRFLRVRGLRLSPTKTKIRKLESGFEFLSIFYQRLDGMLFARPSDNAVTRMEVELTEMIEGYRGSQQSLIEELNKKLIGWGNHHKFTDAQDAFRHIDAVVNALLLDLCGNRRYKYNRNKILKNYFVKDADGEYVYCMTDKRNVRVFRLSKLPIVSHTPAALAQNPYLNPQYFLELRKERDMQNVAGRYRAVWLRQEGKCYYCGSAMLPDQEKKVITIDPELRQSKSNMAYIHTKCGLMPLDSYKTSQYFANSTDAIRLMEEIGNKLKMAYSDKQNRFAPLKDFLWTQIKPSLTLKFVEIEAMLGLKIPEPSGPNSTAPITTTSNTTPPNIAAPIKTVWKRRWNDGINNACYEAGYEIHHVNYSGRTITFKRIGEKAATLKIPDVFLKGKVPADAATELMDTFRYIREKYGF